MFFLSLLGHSLRLPPISLKLPLHQGIKCELEKLFLDKVIPDLGLCISIYDIRSIDGGLVSPGEGAPTYTVKFRLIMFRPYRGEVIVAKLKECDSKGLHLSLGFFDDIYVPGILMLKPSRFETDPENDDYNRWIWEYVEGSKDKFVIDGTAEIRFRVHNVKYPTLPIEQPNDLKPFAPMMITGSIDDDGLGPVSWWLNKGGGGGGGGGEGEGEGEGEEDEEEEAKPES